MEKINPKFVQKSVQNFEKIIAKFVKNINAKCVKKINAKLVKKINAKFGKNE